MPQFEAIVPFGMLVQSALDYMSEHAKDASSAQPDLVYLQDRYDGSILMRLVTKDGMRITSDPISSLAAHTVYDELGSWSGYSADCPFNFCWQSCSDSELTAYRLGDGTYRLVCLPANGRSDCNYMRALAGLGAEWRQMNSEDEEPRDDRDMTDLLGRAWSGC